MRERREKKEREEREEREGRVRKERRERREKKEREEREERKGRVRKARRERREKKREKRGRRERGDSRVLVGAPKANTSQPHVTEGGAVFSCPWNRSNCTVLHFDELGDRRFYINEELTQVEFKSHQWFGATLRSHGNSILVRATIRA
uniref:Uncharacterized protein n=1 Tax=Knipowitschia caucasica TaxID=637954 RepID=A0AAV2M3G3_KNICA